MGGIHKARATAHHGQLLTVGHHGFPTFSVVYQRRGEKTRRVEKWGYPGYITSTTGGRGRLIVKLGLMCYLFFLSVSDKIRLFGEIFSKSQVGVIFSDFSVKTAHSI